MKIFSSVTLVSCLSLANLPAALLVYEPFGYPPDLSDAVAGAQNGKNGGTGFAGPWEDMTTGSNAGEE